MENLINRITIIHEICHGKPTIRGLRYPVENILELMASGMTIEELLADYPDLEREDFLACLDYASKLVQVKSIQMISRSNLVEISRSDIADINNAKGIINPVQNIHGVTILSDM
jgi:uncharacterized protein (DUF433 family)